MSLSLNRIIWFLGIGACPILLAQAASSQTPKQKKSSQSGTEFEFEGVSLKGDRATPMASILEQASPDQTYDFVNIRGNWRKEMAQSAESLDAQGSSSNLQND